MFRSVGPGRGLLQRLGSALASAVQLELLAEASWVRDGSGGARSTGRRRGGPPPKTQGSAAAPQDSHRSVASPVDSSPALDSGVCLERLRALGLRGIRRLTLTRNRTTMVSFRGDELRAHRAFAAAPDEVLRAVIDFVNGRGAVRRRARRLLLAFDGPSADPGPARGPRQPERTHPDDQPLVERLQRAHQEVNRARFDDTLGPVRIRVSRRMRSRLGHFAPGKADTLSEIAIARRHFRRDGWASALETLVHEMVHQWQHETGRPLAHDAEFRRMARQVGIAPEARRRAGRTD